MKDNRNLEWEEIFANEDTHKKFISKTYKEPHTAQYQKHRQPKTQMGQTQKWVFLGGRHTDCDQAPEDILSIANSYTNSASLILTLTQSKSNEASTSHRSERPSQNVLEINARDSVERRKCSCTVVGNVQWRSTRENSMEVLKKQNREVPSDPAIPCLGIHQEKTNILKDTGTPTICSPPGSSVPGVSQARILEWVAMPSSRGSFAPRDQTQVSCIAGRFFTV